MAGREPSFCLPPKFTFPPNGPLRLGSVFASRDSPEYSLIPRSQLMTISDKEKKSTFTSGLRYHSKKFHGENSSQPGLKRFFNAVTRVSDFVVSLFHDTS